MPYYLIDTTMGRCVREASSLQTARTAARREHGTRHFDSAKTATLDDLLEVKKCGGMLPLTVRPEVETYEQRLRSNDVVTGTQGP